MKITHIETYPVGIPLKPERRMISSLGQHTVSRYLLVRRADRRGHRRRRRGDGHAALERRNGLGRAGADRSRSRAALHRLRSARHRRDRPPHGRGLRAQLVRQIRHRNGLLGHPAARPRASRSTSCWAGRVRPLAIRSRFWMGAYEPRRAPQRGHGARRRGLHHDQSQSRRRRGRRHRARPHRARGDRARDRR